MGGLAVHIKKEGWKFSTPLFQILMKDLFLKISLTSLIRTNSTLEALRRVVFVACVPMELGNLNNGN